MLKKTIKHIVSSATFAASLAFPSAALAQTVNPVVPTQITHIGNIINVINAAVRFILLAAFILAFIFLLIGGIRWITAGGDEKAVASARGMITAALIGLVVVLVAYALVRVVETFFNVRILTDTSTTVPQIVPGF